MESENSSKFDKYRASFVDAFPCIVDQALAEEERIPELAGACEWIRKVFL